MKKIDSPDIQWNGLIESAKSTYKYQPTLTAKFDAHVGDFTETTILEIVLWKTNR